MTSRDYIEVAKLIADQVESTNPRTEGTRALTLETVARGLADIFMADNSRFDRQRFYFACALNENGRMGEATAELRSVTKPTKTRKPRKPAQSPQLKKFLSIKFPTHAGTSPESEYRRTMGRWPDASRNVDVTLEHNGQVIHCNDPVGLKTASSYLKQVSL